MKKWLPLFILLNAFAKGQLISFTENKGQVRDQNYKPRPDVLFGATIGNTVVHIKTSGVSYQLNRVDTYEDFEDPKTKQIRKEIGGQTIYRIDLNWINADKNFKYSAHDALPGFNNYYLENCPNGILNVKNYKSITLTNLYNGISLYYYEKAGQLKYDYRVAPGADYRLIQMQVEGAEISVNKDGSLILTTPLGRVQEDAPVVYQNGKKLEAKWLVKNNILSFDVTGYNSDYELIIDPITRLWATYYGGYNAESGYGASPDSNGNIFMCGETRENINSAAIATGGAHQTTFGGFYNDAFLVKFNSSGVRQWGTYYGGMCYDVGYSCATDKNGNVYMAGATCSTNTAVMATAGGHQPAAPVLNNWSAFLVKFDSLGVRQWGTYYGINGTLANSCATDNFGHVYMSGEGSEASLTTFGSYQPNCAGGTDSYLVKFNSNGIRQWGTYYGGEGWERGAVCGTDRFGNIFMSGKTDSGNGTSIATPAAQQISNGGGVSDAYLVKFDSLGVRQWGTYYGDSGEDIGTYCAADKIGNVFLAGYTTSGTGNAIATPGSHQANYGGGTYDSFLAKFDSSGVRQWGTYYGDVGIDYSSACATDSLNNVYITGRTTSATGTTIATANGFQPVKGNAYDAFYIKFNSNGTRQWGTYYGGQDYEQGNFCTVDNLQNLYFGGLSGVNPGTIIATAGSHQPNNGGASDAFLVKFSKCSVDNLTAANNGPLCTGSTISLTAAVSNTLIVNYAWFGVNNYTSSAVNPTISNSGVLNSGTYTLTVDDGQGCYQSATTNVLVNPLPVLNITSADSSICLGQSTSLIVSGADTYTWNTGATTGFIAITPTATTVYSVSGTSVNGCIALATATQNVSVCTWVSGLISADDASCIYPNPTNGMLSVTSAINLKTLELYTSTGQMLFEEQLNATGCQLNLQLLANGVYFIKITDVKNQTKYQKIILQK